MSCTLAETKLNRKSTRTHGSVWTAIMSFFVLLDSAELVLSSPLWKIDADIPYQRIMKYNVTITKSGEWYNERIEVDEEKQTELIKVPATSKKHRSNILLDFKTNTSMFQLPDKKICLFMPFDQETPSPSQLIRSLDSEKDKEIEKRQQSIQNDQEIVDDENENPAIREQAGERIKEVIEQIDALENERERL
ncbi:uncharacterized protein LOC111333281 [Stylophora pistillata]|uniref:Uncharacterized protein n=1 Tax=Stylophora pistillata TaxID=50429 RepID=A0A2B4S3N2_STYPI|nr:uncharacterized protein LOC111333281 [Stylophora pistillata]PFX23168.1 hypothetical protein AWC38_SpisGene12302 [Stylophora pistillata]